MKLEKYFTKEKKPDRKYTPPTPTHPHTHTHTACFFLYARPIIRNHIESESRLAVARAWEGGKESVIWSDTVTGATYDHLCVKRTPFHSPAKPQLLQQSGLGQWLPVAHLFRLLHQSRGSRLCAPNQTHKASCFPTSSLWSEHTWSPPLLSP